jgi:hypothetical protein
VGKQVLLKVNDGTMRIYRDDELLTIYALGTGKGAVIAHPWLYEALRHDAEQVRKKYRAPYGKAKATIGLCKHNPYGTPVQVRDMGVYEQIAQGGTPCLN